MNLLLDTQLLLWASLEPKRLGQAALDLTMAPGAELFFSAASLWEIAIKRGLGRSNFQIDPAVLRRGLLDNGFHELAIVGEHAVAITGLPPIHKDPFDRMLLAQAIVEGITLLTTDTKLATYPGPVQAV